MLSKDTGRRASIAEPGNPSVIQPPDSADMLRTGARRCSRLSLLSQPTIALSSNSVMMEMAHAKVDGNVSTSI